MALIRSTGVLALCTLVLMSCGTQDETTGVSIAADSVRNIFNRPEPPKLTATRASLTARGFDQPLIIATLGEPEETRAGLLQVGQNQGVIFWQSGDSIVLRTKTGVLAGTTALGYDLYTAETDSTLAALQSGGDDSYTKTYRFLTAVSQIDAWRFFCEMSGPTSEAVDVFQKTQQLQRFTERCTSEREDVTGSQITLENTYWKDPARLFVWKSNQWVSPELGYILLERVFE